MNDLKIIIQAAIDPVTNKKTLQQDLDKIKDLKIDIGIDTNALNKLSKQIGDIQKVITQQSKNVKIFDEVALNKALTDSTDKTKKLFTDVKNVLSDVEKEYSQFGKITFPNMSLNPITKDLESFTVQIKKADETVEKLKFDLVGLVNSGKEGSAPAFLIQGQKGTDNTNALIDKAHADAIKMNQKLDEDRIKQLTEKQAEMDRAHTDALKMNQKFDNDRQKVLQEEQKIRKAIDDTQEKADQKELQNAQKVIQERQKLKDQNLNTQTNLLTSADQAHASYHGNIDAEALKNLVQRINSIDPASATATKDLQKMQQELRQLKVDATETANSISGKLKHSIESMALWAVGGGVFFGGIEVARNTIESITDVEKSMAGLRQTIPEIHDSQTALNDATGQFIGIAEKYGESVSSIIDNAKLWSRQYKDLGTVIELVNSSVLLSVVDNVSLEEANKSVESIMVQTGMVIDQTKSKAEQQAQAFEYSRKIVDSFSNASHQSMISANDLATGLERSANVAKKVGVDFDQLVGLMTASVRSTGLAGSNLGNMWKTVFGSIHDTKTAVPELEAIGVQMKQIGKDGIETWTPVADVMRQVMILTAGTQKDTEELTKAASGGRPLVICHL